MIHYQIQVTGKVQGVAFRYYTKQKADELEVEGTVENKMDGSVVIFVNGSDEKVDLLIQWCHQGSPVADVKEVKCTKLSASESREYQDFSILR